MSFLTVAFENILKRTKNDSAFGLKILIKKSKVYAPTETEVSLYRFVRWCNTSKNYKFHFLNFSRLNQTVWALRIPANSLNSCHLSSAAVTESQLKPPKKETHGKECFLQGLRQPTKPKGKTFGNRGLGALYQDGTLAELYSPSATFHLITLCTASAFTFWDRRAHLSPFILDWQSKMMGTTISTLNSNTVLKVSNNLAWITRVSPQHITVTAPRTWGMGGWVFWSVCCVLTRIRDVQSVSWEFASMSIRVPTDTLSACRNCCRCN